MPKKIKVLIVDDSAFIRKAMRRMLSSDPMLEVAGDAMDGPAAIIKVKELKPDVITLDVNMPGMNGIEVLKRIMKENPTPVLMVSSLTNEGGGITLSALEAGAVDFIDKSSCHTIMDILNIADTLIAKVKMIAGVDIQKVMDTAPRPKPTPPLPPRKAVAPPSEVCSDTPTHIVAIGASTGGPMSLESVLCNLPANYPGAILVVQHMPIGFTQSFAERLNTLCRMKVQEAKEDSPILPGNIYIGPAGYHIKMQSKDGKYKVLLSKTPRDAMHIPSVDELMKSVAETWPGTMLGVILTGMGQDGTEGAKEMKRQGATIVSQDEATCVVYGMPRSVYLAGCVDQVLPLPRICEYIDRFC